jgi:LPS export ABC transporter permease LptF/LPS export ABC transporter permease LptG
MRLLTRYILREVLSHALLGGVLFTFVLFTSRLGKILEVVVRDSASLSDAARLVAYFLPEALIVTIPMAVLVGILLGLSRLAADSEITAMRAAGMGALDFVRVVSFVSFGALALGLVNSLYLAPRAAASLLALQDTLKYSQASFEVEPRVFDEDFKNIVLYVQDVRPGSGAALWRHVFVADLTEPATPRITTAELAIVTSAGPGSLNLHLTDGAQHEISPTDPNQYNISTFHTTDIPMQTGAQEDTHLSRSDTPILALSLPDLLEHMRNPPPPAKVSPSGPQPGKWVSATDRARASRIYRIELNKRFSYPFACLVLMLVGVPLGLSSKRGGKSAGFVLTILLVFIYYFLSSVGVALANQGKLPAFLGVWGANLLFAITGVLLLQQLSRGGVALNIFSSLGSAITQAAGRLRSDGSVNQNGRPEQDLTSSVPQRLRSMLRIQFPLILDDYIMREFAGSFALVLTTFSLVFLIFTFFELIGDIIRNRIAFVTVGDYLLNLIPYILYNVTPLCVLVAVLVTFGGLAKTSEFTAMKACGLSLYRVVAPVLVVTAVIAVSLFAFDESYLPAANRRQEALRSEIKGKPAQTFLRPDRQWISGQTLPTATSQLAQPAEPHPLQAGTGTRHSGEPARIFFYKFFDPDRNVFANLTVFEIDPATFTLTRRIFAESARWDGRVSQWILENGWSRTFSGEVSDSYTPFVLSTFPEIREQPQYFKKEDRQSQEMSFNELSAYIQDLRQSGFDTKRLSVQLDRKLAYPAITLVMAILAVPFALSTGKRGGVAGFAIAILLAVLYLGISGLFEAMGNVNTLPPTLAAWAADLLFTFAGAYFLLRTPT